MTSALTVERVQARYASPERHIRPPLPTLLVGLVLLAQPPVTHAQSSRGSIEVGATILPGGTALAPTRVTIRERRRGEALLGVGPARSLDGRTVTSFVRISRVGVDSSAQPFVLQRRDSTVSVRVPSSPTDHQLRIERLVTAGT